MTLELCVGIFFAISPLLVVKKNTVVDNADSHRQDIPGQGVWYLGGKLGIHASPYKLHHHRIHRWHYFKRATFTEEEREL